MMEKQAILDQGEALLGRLARAETERDAVAAEYARALESLKAVYAGKLQPLVEKVKALGKDIPRFAKKHHTTLFKESDLVTLPSGELRYAESKAVVHGRSVTVEVLRGLGYLDGIHVEESVDWDVLDGWPDEKLLAAGTTRKDVKAYTWELKQKEKS